MVASRLFAAMLVNVSAEHGRVVLAALAEPLARVRVLAPVPAAFTAAAAAVVVLVLVIVEQGATMGIPGSGNSRELSGIPGSDFSLPGSETRGAVNPTVKI